MIFKRKKVLLAGKKKEEKQQQKNKPKKGEKIRGNLKNKPQLKGKYQLLNRMA